MSATYDPALIQSFADSLYARATGLTLRMGLLGALVGAGLTQGVFAMERGTHDAEGVLTLLLAGVTAAIFASSAKGRADALRLQAQTALCQVAIEANTRRIT